MSERTIVIKETNSGRVLASGVKDAQVQLFEGCWYFDPQDVDTTHLVKTDRTYLCPYKGTCYWYDLVSPEKRVENVAWVYFDVKPGYRFIKDKIAFYAGRREATFEDEEQ